MIFGRWQLMNHFAFVEIFTGFNLDGSANATNEVHQSLSKIANTTQPSQLESRSALWLLSIRNF